MRLCALSLALLCATPALAATHKRPSRKVFRQLGAAERAWRPRGEAIDAFRQSTNEQIAELSKPSTEESTAIRGFTAAVRKMLKGTLKTRPWQSATIYGASGKTYLPVMETDNHELGFDTKGRLVALHREREFGYLSGAEWVDPLKVLRGEVKLKGKALTLGKLLDEVSSAKRK